MTARDNLREAILAGYVVEGLEPLHTEAEADALIDAYTAETQQPRRGDQFEQWLKAHRDRREERDGVWWYLDEMLDQYRLHADTRTPLDQHVCQAGTFEDCAGCHGEAKQ